MDIPVFSWNSQGNRWDYFVNEVIPSLYAANGIPFIAYFCEVGNWGKSNTKKDQALDLNGNVTVDNTTIYYRGVWVGWCAKNDGTGNYRCSVAMIEVTSASFNWDINYFPSRIKDKDGNIRPIVFAENNKRRIYGIHAISNQYASPGELRSFAWDCGNESKGYPWLAVGDMNFDLKNNLSNQPFTEFDGVNMIFCSDEKTQRKGGQLDWAFGNEIASCYTLILMGVTNTNGKLISSEGLGKSPSDHAGLLYLVNF